MRRVPVRDDGPRATSVEPSASSTRTLTSLSPPFVTLNRYHEPLREHALLACNVL